MKALHLVLLVILVSGSGFAEDLLSRVQGEYNEAEAQTLIREITKTNKDVDLYVGIVYHNLTRLNPEKYIDKALRCLEAAYNNSKAPLALAYYGSALTLQAGIYADEGDIFKATALLEKGINFIDEAVGHAPDLSDLRFLRLVNSVALSEASPLNRMDMAKQDLSVLESRYNSFNARQKAVFRLYQAKIAIFDGRIEDALGSLEQSIRECPHSDIAKQAEALLAEWEE